MERTTSKHVFGHSYEPIPLPGTSPSAFQPGEVSLFFMGDVL